MIWHSIANLDTPKLHVCKYVYIYISYVCVAFTPYLLIADVVTLSEAMDLPHCRYCTLQRNDLRRQIEGGESIGAGRRAIMESPDLRNLTI